MPVCLCNASGKAPVGTTGDALCSVLKIPQNQNPTQPQKVHHEVAPPSLLPTSGGLPLILLIAQSTLPEVVILKYVVAPTGRKGTTPQEAKETDGKDLSQSVATR